MKLRWSPTSPYVRKVTVTAIETGIEDQIEMIPTNVWDAATDIAKDNPLGKVPALIIEGGEILYDSPVICEYLDSRHDGIKLFPPAGGARWRALRRQALADGLIDAAVARLIETGRRPAELRWPVWAERQQRVMWRALNALEEEADDLEGPVTIGHIAIGCALGYLDLRFAEDNWRSTHAQLARWYEGFSRRRSMRETVPAEAA